MRELVILSGKGGTGKTSLTASFAVLAANAVLADCDVDAANLHLVLEPRVQERHEFWCGHEAVIRPDACTGCGRCVSHCRFEAITLVPGDGGRPLAAIAPPSCEGCGVCVRVCPHAAIDFPERLTGAYMISSTRCGPMVHARLGIAAENSGKLVATVRENARRLARRERRDLILIDGPPGVACPAMASLTGASEALIVTEPTLSGAHDLARVLALTSHFGIPTAVSVNKWDIDPAQSAAIERQATAAGARLAGRIRYDRAVTDAQMAGLTVVETDAPSADDVRAVWAALTAREGPRP